MFIIIVILLIIAGIIILQIPKPEIDGDAIVFTSSITRGADPTAPERLIFSQDGLVTWAKNRGVNYFYSYMDQITIPRKQIVGIRIHKKMIGVDIEIIGKGVQQIYASRFTGEDARKIEMLLKGIMSKTN